MANDLELLQRYVDDRSEAAFAELVRRNVDLVYCTALRHVSDLRRAFGEFFRVLRPRGRVVVLELSRPASRAGQRVAGWYLGRVLPRVTRLATRSDDAELMMRYYWQTIANCVSPDTILTAMRHAGFRDVHRTVYFGICSEYYGTKI